jgi:hypothetical protein
MVTLKDGVMVVEQRQLETSGSFEKIDEVAPFEEVKATKDKGSAW